MNDYDDFVKEIETSYEELWSIAKQKLQEVSDAMDTLAAQSMLSMGPLLIVAGYGIAHGDQLGSEGACDYEGTRKKLLDYAESYCFDSSSVEEAIDALDSAVSKFSIGDAHSDISGKLESSWPEATNDTAKLFKDNYVSPIIDIQANQKAAIELAIDDLKAVPPMVKNNRKALKDSITDLTEKLSKHNPYETIGFDVLHLTLFAWGLVTPDPVTGRLSGVVDLILTENKKNLIETDVGLVAEAFKALRDAVDDGEKAAKDVIDGFADTVDTTLSDLQVNHVDYFVSRPG